MSGLIGSRNEQLEQLQVRNQEYPIPTDIVATVDVSHANVLVMAGTTLTEDMESYKMLLNSADSVSVEPIDAYAGLEINKRFGEKIQTTQLSMNNFKHLTILANPPYNDGSKGRTPIYDKFLELAIDKSPQQTVFIIPINWFSQNHNSFGKTVRKHLKTLGVYKIVVNPVNMFDNAKVSTCTVYCKAGYNGTVDLVEKVTGTTRIITNFDDRIIAEFDPVVLNLLNRIKPKKYYNTFPKGGDTDVTKWRVGTSYKKENFHIDPINPWRVIPPNHKGQNGYRIIASFDTEEEAKSGAQKINSYWMSKPILFILRKTRTSTTLDGPQMRYIPMIDSYDRVLTEEEVAQILNLTDSEKKVIYGQE